MPEDPLFPLQTALHVCRFPRAWEIVGDSPRLVRVAIVDSGVNQAHPDLPATRFEPFHHRASDDAGHGTAVAGIIGATRDNGKGISGAARCEMTIYRVFDAANDLDRSTYYAALQNIAASDAKVVNLSVSGLSADPNERRLIEACVASGKTVVAAMGNVSDFGEGAVLFPAALGSVIAVGSATAEGEREPYSIAGRHIWISAPGSSIWSTSSLGGCAQVTGTSFATPLVTAACALLYQRWPSITPGQVAQALCRLVSLRDEARGWSEETGWGVLDIGRINELATPT